MTATRAERMVRSQILTRGVDDPRLIALERVDRARFVPPGQRDAAFSDGPLPIGHGQTISQPFIVALMTHLLEVRPGARILEIGIGSGYQTAILLELGAVVYGVERLPALTRTAQATLAALGYRDFHLVTADGTLGWPGRVPAFDGILVAAAAPRIPHSLQRQLSLSGRLVIPVGDRFMQELLLVTKSPDGDLRISKQDDVRFVPLVGQEGY